ncbi:MAG: NAD(P)/FAD-dependent oxidoreductase [Pyrinomonadaceae bacterium]
MAKILILGGGFGGVVAAERLVKELGAEHQITLVSRSRRFVFYPALVRLAFGECEPGDVSFDLRQTMLSRRVNFIEAEVARIDPHERKVITAHGETEGNLPYDYLIYALGRRLATERITGFFEHAHHLLNVDKALEFGKAVAAFHKGRAVIGQCPGARLPVPVYETAFALSRLLQERGERERAKITIVSPDPPGFQFGDGDVARALRDALDTHSIEFLPDFPIEQVTPGAVMAGNGQAITFNLLMLLPPSVGSSAASYLGITDEEGYIYVDEAMRVVGVGRMYAVGDCVNFRGPKLGHMAVRQADVAAANLAAEIQGHEPPSSYNHEMMLVIDEGGSESIYVHKDLWTDEQSTVKQGRFWSWAKRVQEKYWEAVHF